jgi:ADP-ribosylglycohydrolase
MRSEPYGLGQSNTAALKALAEEFDPADLVKHININVTKFNSKSQSNGALMRCMPLAIYCHSLHDYEEFRKVIQADVSFTHCHENVLNAQVLYAMAIGRLMAGLPAKDVFNLVRLYAKT